MFYVGQKVVCINVGPVVSVRGKHTGGGLKIGCEYTISSGTHIDDDGLECVSLFGDDYHARLASRFRPVVQTDISVFTAMLTRYPTKVGADA